MRQLLYMASIRAREVNGNCKALYERLLAAGKAKLVALLAVALYCSAKPSGWPSPVSTLTPTWLDHLLFYTVRSMPGFFQGDNIGLIENRTMRQINPRAFNSKYLFSALTVSFCGGVSSA